MFHSEFLEKFDINSVELLGETMSSMVFRANHKLDEGAFAVKVIPFSENEEESRSRAVREVRMLRELDNVDHPNILRYNSSWMETPPETVSGYPFAFRKWLSLQHTFLFIQTEYCSEGTLETWMNNRGVTHTIDSKINLFRDVVNGLCYIHAKGKIHRDLKPHNIFLKVDWTGQLRARIGDFGSTRDLSVSKMSKGGTQLYSSPEQLAGGEYTEKTDIFPMGLILYELLRESDFGNPNAFYGRVAYEDMKQVRCGHLPEPFNRKCPNESAFIQEMLKGKEEANSRPSANDIKLRLDILLPIQRNNSPR